MVADRAGLSAHRRLVDRLAVHVRLGIPVPGGTAPEVDDYTARTNPAKSERVALGALQDLVGR